MKPFRLVALITAISVSAGAQGHGCKEGKTLPFGVLIDGKDSWVMLAQWASPDSASSVRSAQAQASYDMGAMLATLAKDSSRLERVPGLGWKLRPGREPVRLLTGFPAKLSIGTRHESGGFCTYATLFVKKGVALRFFESNRTRPSSRA